MKRHVHELKSKLIAGLLAAASRDQGIVDRLCRMLATRLLTLPPEDDFMRDTWIDNDTGFDPDELDRYQRGDSSAPVQRSGP